MWPRGDLFLLRLWPGSALPPVCDVKRGWVSRLAASCPQCCSSLLTLQKEALGGELSVTQPDDRVKWCCSKSGGGDSKEEEEGGEVEPPLVAGWERCCFRRLLLHPVDGTVAVREKKTTAAAAAADDLHFLFETFSSVWETNDASHI